MLSTMDWQEAFGIAQDLEENVVYYAIYPTDSGRRRRQQSALTHVEGHKPPAKGLNALAIKARLNSNES